MTEQAEFWRGTFGDAYCDRNASGRLIHANQKLFQCALRDCGPVASVLEFGPNIGLNLLALREIFPNIECHGVEINSRAAAMCRSNVSGSRIVESSVIEAIDSGLVSPCDLVLFKGLLIHLNPAELPRVYVESARLARRFVMIAEYYNPVPVAIDYRGNSERLYKRDFAGEFLDLVKSFRLRDYGFVYHRDRDGALDDITWFLLERE